MASIISERYALSLYEVAKQENKVQEFMDEFNAVCDVFNENPDFLKVLKTPSIQFAEKKNTISAVFEGRIHPYMLNFLMLITERNRIGLIFEMAESYKEQYYFEEGICEVTAITASKMDDAISEKLKNKSWVMGLVDGIFSIFLIIELASAEPIQIGKARLFSRSFNTTMGEPLLVSSAIPITLISIIKNTPYTRSIIQLKYYFGIFI